MIRAVRILFVAAMIGSAGIQIASAEGEWVSEWSNGFKVESTDGQFKLKFGGRVQADYTFAFGDEDLRGPVSGNGFEFRRSRLFFEGTIYDRVKFKVQYDFAGGSADFNDVYVELLNDAAGVRFGHYKEYLSLEALTSAKYIAFIERSLPVEAFAPGRNSGVGVHGMIGDRLNWGFGVFYDADDFGTSTKEGDVNITGRIAFRPIFEDEGRSLVHVGLAASKKYRESDGTLRFRSRPEAHLSERFVDTGNFASDNALISAVEVAGVKDRFWFAGELLRTSVDSPAFGDPSFDGFYAQVGFFLTDDYRRYSSTSATFDRLKPSRNWDRSGGKGAFEVAARISSLDLSDGGLDGGKEDNITLGLNWYPNPATRLMLNYVHADVDGLGDADHLLFRVQVDF